MKISDLLRFEKLNEIDTSIGLIHIFSLTFGNHSNLIGDLNGPIENTDPTEYIKKLIPYVCYPTESLQENKYRPNLPVLSESNVEKLSNTDLESIAALFVKENPYLYKERINKSKINEKGDTVAYSEFGDVKYPQNDNENNVYYLHRLLCINAKHRVETLKDIASRMPSISSFTSGLSSDIVKNLALGDRLGERLEDLKSFNSSKAYQFENIDFIDIKRKEEKRRREPFDDLAKRLDSLLDTSTQTLEFIIETNKIQTKIAAEIKSGSDSTDRHSKKNLYLTYVVIFLTIVGLACSIWSGLSGVSFSDEQQDIMHNYASMISESLNDSNKTTKENNAIINDALLKIEASMQSINNNATNKDAQIKRAMNEINILKEENKKQSNTIYKLTKEVESLKYKK